MPYKRRYRRAISNPDKYSVETQMFQTSGSINSWELVQLAGRQDTRQFDFIAVPSNNLQGMRKVKHLTMTFSSNTDSPVAYALVYVPAGYLANTIQWPSASGNASIYEPNQFVISRGVLDFRGGPLRITTPLSRNLNSGDSIHLVFATSNLETAPSIITTLKYAITLQ